jgi:hypothetical protein
MDGTKVPSSTLPTTAPPPLPPGAGLSSLSLHPTRTTVNTGSSSHRSVSMASVSSEGSNGSGNPSAVDPVEVRALTGDVKVFNKAMSRLRSVNQPDPDSVESIKFLCHERLGELLNILRNMLEKYPSLRSPSVINSASYLVVQLKDYAEQDDWADEKEFHDAIDNLAITFSNRVSEYLTGDIAAEAAAGPSRDYHRGSGAGPDYDGAPAMSPFALAAAAASAALDDDLPQQELLTPEEIDRYWMLNAKGVDHALHYAKMWSKYAKEVMNYVDKRAGLEQEMARGLSKLAQSTRPALKEESYLPLQSVFCTALDQDLEMCARTQATCSELQGNKFVEPLQQRLSEQNKSRQALKKRWVKELKRVSEAVINLNKAKSMYHDRNKEYERCVEAVRIAEQAAELGAAGEGKVDKRKRLEEDALAKTREYKTHYMQCVEEANSRHRRVYELKAEVLVKIREMILQCDQTMKTVTVAYHQMQHKLTSPVPIQFQSLCEKSRLYEPGSQFMDYAKTMLQQEGDAADQSSDPFKVELPGMEGRDELMQFFGRGHSSSGAQRKSVDLGDEGTYKFKGDKSGPAPPVAWAPSMCPIEPSDTDSIESRDSCKSLEASPPASPCMMRHPPTSQQVDEVDADGGGGGGGGREGMIGPSGGATAGDRAGGSSSALKDVKESLASQTHRFRKLKTPTKCRECDSYVFVGGFDCQDCGLSVHRKCLEVLALQCGHKRLPRKMPTFGVDLGQHLLESGAHIPPIVSKCVAEIERRGVHIKGIYRMSGVKHKVAKICQAFESAPDLVELTDIQPNIIANVLKRYMSDLPEPLITVVLYPDFVRVAKKFPNKSPAGYEDHEDVDEVMEATVVSELTELTRRLPRHHLRTLEFLMHHLLRVSKKSDHNGMTANNLARVFCPTLMRTAEGSDSLSSLFDTDHQTRVVELLILHAATIFGPPESVLPSSTSSGSREDGYHQI